MNFKHPRIMVVVEVRQIDINENTMGSVPDMNLVGNMPNSNIRPTPAPDVVEEYGSNLKLLPTNNQVRELQTILRDR